MKEYRVETISKMTTSKLTSAVEKTLSEQTAAGWEIVSVSFSFNI